MVGSVFYRWLWALRTSALLPSIFMLQACAVGADYKEPRLNVASDWHAKEQAQETLSDLPDEINDAADVTTQRSSKIKKVKPGSEKWSHVANGALAQSEREEASAAPEPEILLPNAYQEVGSNTSNLNVSPPPTIEDTPPKSKSEITELSETWWETFNDPMLSQLVQQALAQNNEIKGAQARVAEARANETIGVSGLLPQIDGRASKTRGTMGGSFGDRLDTTSQRGVSGRLEIDVFGAMRRRIESATAAVAAEEESLAQTRQQVVSQVVRLYIQVRSLQEQERLTEQNLTLQKRSQVVTQAQRKEQMVSDLNVYRARAQVLSTQARLPQIRSDLYAGLNRLSSLLAINIRDTKAMLNTPAPLPKSSVESIDATPIDTIRKRPDVMVAERRLAQNTALKAAAFADFFPKISLEGFFGTATSGVFGDITSWNGTLGGVLPLLNFGRLSGQYDAADARQRQAFYNYKQTVLSAVEEVEASYFAHQAARKRTTLVTDIAKAQSGAATVAREQYFAGIAQQLDLLDAERGALDAQVNAVQTQAQELIALVQLYTALGVYHPSAEEDMLAYEAERVQQDKEADELPSEEQP